MQLSLECGSQAGGDPCPSSTKVVRCRHSYRIISVRIRSGEYSNRCEYCGTYYDNGFNPFRQELKIIRTEAPVEVLKAGTSIDSRLISTFEDEEVKDMVIHEIARKMIENIIPYVTITEDEDREHQLVRYTAKIRMIKPDFKFE